MNEKDFCAGGKTGMNPPTGPMTRETASRMPSIPDDRNPRFMGRNAPKPQETSHTMNARHTESTNSKSQQMLSAFTQEVTRTITLQKANNGVSRLAIVRTYFAPITRMIEAGITIEEIAKAIPGNLIDHKMLQSYLSRERRELAKNNGEPAKNNGSQLKLLSEDGQANESTSPAAPEAGHAVAPEAAHPEATQPTKAEHDKKGEEPMTKTETNQAGEIHQMVGDAHQMLDDLHKHIDNMATRMNIINDRRLSESDERIVVLRKLIDTGMLAPAYVDAINGLIEHAIQ